MSKQPLNEQKVIEIKKLLLTNEKTVREIAALYKVSPSTIMDIKQGRTWKRVVVNMDQQGEIKTNVIPIIPAFFTKEWYLEQKEQKKTDEDIVEELEISLNTLGHWKRNKGCVGVIEKSLAGRKPHANVQRGVELYKKGLTLKDAASSSGIAVTTLRKYLKLANIKIDMSRRSIKRA